jgi:hypothetical protein
VALELGAPAAGRGGIVHHANGLAVIAFVVDADFGDHQRWVFGSDLPSCDVHPVSSVRGVAVNN